LVYFDYTWIFLCFVLAEPPKLSIFSHDICFDFRLNHEQNKKIDCFFEKKIYPLVDKLIRFILTLPVSTATTEWAFLAMNIVKIRLCNMEDDFLANYLIVYIVKEITERFTIDTIIGYFYFMKERWAQLK